MLDQEDSAGIICRYERATTAGARWGSADRCRASALAHDDAVNGLQWTSDGNYIVSAGLDRRIRVWDAATGANTLASFGSLVQNSAARTASFFLSPTGLTSERGLLFCANDHGILVFDLHQGNLVSRLKSPGASNPLGRSGRDRGNGAITSIAWRGAGGSRYGGPIMGGGNSVGAIYSAHLDGQIRAWMPHIQGQEEENEDEVDGDDDQVRRRKRKAVDDAYRSLMGKQVTFT